MTRTRIELNITLDVEHNDAENNCEACGRALKDVVEETVRDGTVTFKTKTHSVVVNPSVKKQYAIDTEDNHPYAHPDGQKMCVVGAWHGEVYHELPDGLEIKYCGHCGEKLADEDWEDVDGGPGYRCSYCGYFVRC